jgi:hypothetical protein
MTLEISPIDKGEGANASIGGVDFLRKTKPVCAPSVSDFAIEELNGTNLKVYSVDGYRGKWRLAVN